MGNSVTEIGVGAFACCERLRSITIPVSVTKIDDAAFTDCMNLKNVYYKGTQEQWNAIDMGAENEYLTGATIHFNFCLHSDKIAHFQQNATCTETGYTAGEYCPDCEMWISGHEVISATGHADANDDGKCDNCSATLREEIEEPETPEDPVEPENPEEPEKEQSGIIAFFTELFRKIADFFKKLFGIMK